MQTIYITPSAINSAPRVIQLDLNGKSITTAPDQPGFAILKGHLDITGSGTITTSLTGTYYQGAAFVLWGSPTYTDDNWTNLTIGEHVSVRAGIGIEIYDTNDAKLYNGSTTKRTYPTGYKTFFSNYYSTNGNLNYDSIPWFEMNNEKRTWTRSSDYQAQAGCAFGVNVVIDGSVYGKKYALQVTGHVNQTPERYDSIKYVYRTKGLNPSRKNYDAKMKTGWPAEDAHFPTFTISSRAKIECAPNQSEGGSAAIYGSGYAVWNIGGTVSGNTGVYCKSGDVTITDATISATGAYAGPTGSNSGIGGAGGSAIVIESNEAYSGDMNVTISGDTKVTATDGYAIQETVTTSEDTEVEAITINGGSFSGGGKTKEGEGSQATGSDRGAVVVSEKTADDDSQATVTVYDANITGTVSYGESGDLSDMLPEGTGENAVHVTIITDENGKSTMVVSQGDVPGDITDWNDVHNGDDVNWKGTADVTIADGTTLSLGELQINSGTDGNEQHLTIEDGGTLKVDRLIMNAYARIVVEAGGKLIVEGTQGINAPSVENIVLEATASKQAMLLFNPAVSSNRQPNATVQLYTYCHQPSASTYKWQRFTTPVRTTLSVVAGTISNDYNESTHGSLVSGSTFTSWVNYWDEMTQTWKGITSWANIKPFEDFMICNNTSAGGVTYTFKGELQGSVSSDLNFEANGWNYFGNSYTAPISVLSMIQQVASSAGSTVDGTVYVWDLDNQIYEAVNSLSFDLAALPGAKPVAHPDVPAMTVFVMKLRTGNDAVANLGYGPSVYEYNNPTNPAPARAMQQNIGVVRLSVVDENGVKDEVALVEGDAFTADFENGADAEKMITENRINFYAGVEMPYAINASDKLEGMVLSLKTADAIDYTLTVDNVVGVDYAIKDNITGQVILLQEGNVYHFNAQPNATLDGRFQIVSRQEMPTAVETVEETVNAPKAIYTIMGQYVGETTDWNNLPAGVYVVDGVKVIK